MAYGRNRGVFAALALAGLASAPVAAAAASGPGFEYRLLPASTAPEPVRRRVRKALGPGTTHKYRSRWKAERQPKRRNLNHVSKRTRRRHRRAKRA